MGQRADALAQQVQQTVDELAAMLENEADGQWKATCAGEQWSVGVTAHHVAAGHLGAAIGFIGMVANGQTPPPLTAEDFDQGNAEHARQHANCTREETLALLRENGAKAVAFVRGLTDEQLDRSAPMAFAGGAPLSAQQLIDAAILDGPTSARAHVASIREAG